MKILQIDSSILGDASISRQLTQAIVGQLQQKHGEAVELEYLDLAAQPIPHLTAEILMGQNLEQAALVNRFYSSTYRRISWWLGLLCITLAYLLP